MRSQMLYTNGPFEDCQVRMFAKQRRTHGWSSYLSGKNIFVPKQKSSNLYIIMFEVSENVSEYVFMNTAVACVHKCFTLTGGLKSGKCECLWSSDEKTAEAVICRVKVYIYPKGKIVKSLHHLCSMSVKTFLSMHLYTLQQHAFINALHWRVIGNLSRTNVCQTASKTQLKQLLAHCTNWTTKKCYYIHCTMKKHAKFYFRMKNPQKAWFAQKNNAKFYLHVAWAFSNCQLLDAEM